MNNLLLASLLFCRTSVSDVLVLLLFPGIFVWAIIAVIIYYFVDRARRSKRRRQRDQLNNQDYLEWRSNVEDTGELAPVPCSLLLKKGEECFSVSQGVTLLEVREVRHTSFLFGSVPVSDTGFNLGGGGATSTSMDVWKPIAKGELYVTNRQVYFNGDKQTRQIPISKIVKIEAGYSAVEISAEAQKKMVFRGCNGQVVRDIVQMIVHNED